MIYCDLCGKPAHCVQKKIDEKEFDLCDGCWNSLAEKLSGKGRGSEAPARVEAEKLEEYEEISVY